MEKRWVVTPPISSEELAAYVPAKPLIAQLLANRGLSPQEARSFLASDNEISWHSPFTFRQMRQAVELIIEQIKEQKLIAICGDYDADGVTSSAVLQETLTTLKAKVQVWIPNRLSEGYGLNRRLIKEIKDAGCSLLITVDNGIRSYEEIAYARKQGLEVIVTDHHTQDESRADLPEAIIINPILEQETYPFKFLAGVGVAFKLATALIEASNLSSGVKERLINRVLDLVAIGTIADCVSLLGENRFLVRQGLRELNRRERPGVNALIKIAQINNEISESNVSWQIAPRLNVAGRLGRANAAYEILVTTDLAEAEKLAEELNEKNIHRQEETQRLVEYATKLVDKELLLDKILVISAPCLRGESEESWHEGIIGLVAGKICERYARPAFVITRSEGKIKGSGRSVEGYNIVALLERLKEYLERFGGHKAACGFTVKDQANLDKFTQELRRIGQEEITDDFLVPTLKIDVELAIDSVDKSLVEDIKRFAPFGQGNREPIFLSRAVPVKDIVMMGADSQHIKFKFHNFWALAFGEAVKWQALKLGDKIDVVYTLEFNDFNGFRNVQMKIIDMRQG